MTDPDPDPDAKKREFSALPSQDGANSTDNAAPKAPRPRRSIFELPDGALAIFFLLIIAAVSGGLIAIYWPWVLGGAEQSGVDERVAALETRVGQIASGQAPSAAAATFDDMRRDMAAMKTRIDADEARLTGLEKAGGQTSDSDVSTLKAALDKNTGDIAALAARIGTQKTKPATAVPDPQIVNHMQATDKALADLKQQLETNHQAVTQELAKLGVRADALEKNAPPADLLQRLDSFALKSGVDALDARVATLEKADVAGLVRRAASVLALADLVRASQTGKSFEPELKALMALMPPSPALGDLGQYAGRDVPTRAELVGRFSAVSDAILVADRKAGAKTWYQRWWAGFVSLVTVRPVGDVKGNSTAARVARAEFHLKHGDLEKAANEIEKLPPGAKSAAANWLHDAKARLAIDEDARQLTNTIINQLGTAMPAQPVSRASEPVMAPESAPATQDTHAGPQE